MGAVPVSILQVRGLKFYPKSLEQGSMSEKALKAAIAQMYLKGVSTRKVSSIVEELCGFEVSSTQVSRLTAELDEQLELFRERKLNDSYKNIYLDAMYEKVRHNGTVCKLGV